MQNEPVKFLIVEDDEVSITKMKRTMARADIGNPSIFARDGIEALKILRGDCEGGRLAPPYIVTLDINMPRMDGHEFLRELRADAQLKNIVVFVLTTSDNQTDINAAYEMNVAGYILKDSPAEGLLAKLSMIESFAKLVVLPS